ncbi:helix-turn-helix domain-containing protein [Azospirillum sp. A39]|uniref:helix-turn-helix domain-containing protein n=1 Tax=Azospirillum sp. A39 TaxID=3462279 RepID=UPI0040458D65
MRVASSASKPSTGVAGSARRFGSRLSIELSRFSGRAPALKRRPNRKRFPDRKFSLMSAPIRGTTISMTIDLMHMSHLPRPPSDPFERRDWISSRAFREHGVSQAEAARRIGISRQAVRQGLVLPSVRVEEFYASLLGYPVQELWPDRYRPDGTRIRRVRDALAEAA